MCTGKVTEAGWKSVMRAERTDEFRACEVEGRRY